jgi:hypothetical protein
MKGYWLSHYFSKRLSDSISEMPSLERVVKAMKASGIEFLGTEKYFIKTDLQDKFLYCGKQNPELYFDDQIRQGNSSFSSLANQKEVQQGLAKLRNDIESGKIKDIISSYEIYYEIIYILLKKSLTKTSQKINQPYKGIPAL